uniref:PTS transporter subunit EIIC n=1 Tax=Escherichia coli TaxID=562 RepID=UPI00098B0028
MLSQIQRFGGAMFTPVLLFPFAGIVVGLAILLQNPMFVGESLTDPNSLFAQIVHIIEEGGWTVFRNMPLIFAVGLPIGLAKQAQGRACLAVMVSFLTWNYFINAMGMTWGSYFGVDFTQDAVASKIALNAIRDGKPVAELENNGVTNGAAMRVSPLGCLLPA